MVVNSPWGPVQYRRMIAPGVVFAESASHGGARPSKELQARIPEHRRTRDGWYEEDCEVAYLVVSLPELFHPDQVDYANKTIAGFGGRDIRMAR